MAISRARALANFIAVQTHTGSQTGSVANVTYITNAFTALNPLDGGNFISGVHTVREDTLLTDPLIALYSKGLCFDIYPYYNSPGTNLWTDYKAAVDGLASVVGSSKIVLLEGPLEINNSSWGIAVTSKCYYTPNGVAQQTAYAAAVYWQKDIWTAYHGTYPIALFSVSGGTSTQDPINTLNAAQSASVSAGLGNLSGLCNFGNCHIYQAGGLDNAVGFSGSGGWLQAETGQTPNLPTVITEWGTESQTDPSGNYYGTLKAQAIYVLNSLGYLYSLNTGAASYNSISFFAWYELIDAGGSYQGYFGLFDPNGNIKQSGQALAYLFAIVGDTAGTANTFTVSGYGTVTATVNGNAFSSLSGTVGPGGQPFQAYSFQIQKANGYNYFILGLTQTVSNSSSQDLTPNSYTVVVTLPSSAATINVYVPRLGTSVQQTASNTNTITFSINADMVVVEIIGSGGGVTAPGTPTLSVGSPTSSSLTVSLSDSSGGTPTGYNLWVSSTGTGTAPGSGWTVVGANPHSYTGATTQIVVGGLSSATTYYFQAEATNSAGTSSNTASISGTTSAGTGGGAKTQVITTVGAGTFSTPSDWNNSNNSIEGIAGGGGGANAYAGPGGGGGAYSKVVNQTISGSVAFNVGAGGAGGVASSTDTAGGAGGDTWVGNAAEGSAFLVAKGGAGGSGAGPVAGGAASAGVGSVKYSGGASGTSGSGSSGGGGAGGPAGNGAAGGSTSATATYYTGAGGGGGGGGAAAPANAGTTTSGTAGGNNSAGSGGGAGGTTTVAPGAGVAGAGGGGAGNGTTVVLNSGGAGGAGTDLASGTAGSGGGGGGGGQGYVDLATGGAGGLYGGGGGGGAYGNTSGGGPGGAGAQGVIVLTWTPASGLLAPGAPTVALSNPTTSSLVASLTDSSGGLPASYNLYYSLTGIGTAPGSGWTAVSGNPISYSGTTTNYTVLGLSSGTTYYFQATATNATGTSANSANVSGSTASSVVAPGVPSVSVGSATLNSLTLSIADNSGGTPTGYNVYSSLSGSGIAPGSGWTALAGNPQAYTPGVTTLTVSSLAAGTTYYFQVNAINSAGPSAYSPNAIGTTTSSGSPPGAPSIAITAKSATTITLTITSGSGSAPTSYAVYRSPTRTSAIAPAAPWVQISGSPFAYQYTSQQITDTGLNENAPYYYAAVATNASGSSSVSQFVRAITLPYQTYINVLTSGSSWTVPPNWNSSNNNIVTIGAGGGGAAGLGGGGGGGGAYAKITNLTLSIGALIPSVIGSGGAGGNGGINPGKPGGDTYFGGASLPAAFVGAQGGLGGGLTDDGASGGAGGAASGSVGTTRYSGGSGGSADQGSSGGGGAGGPFGPGADAGSTNTVIGNFSGSGGGGGSGGLAGQVPPNSSTVGANGGLNHANAGAGVAGTSSVAATAGASGKSGAGGGGAGVGGSSVALTAGGAGGAGTGLGGGLAGAGGGGGGGGQSNTPGTAGNGGNGGLYGGGGGGGGFDSNFSTSGNGGTGAQGVIIITWLG